MNKKTFLTLLAMGMGITGYFSGERAVDIFHNSIQAITIVDGAIPSNNKEYIIQSTENFLRHREDLRLTGQTYQKIKSELKAYTSSNDVTALKSALSSSNRLPHSIVLFSIGCFLLLSGGVLNWYVWKD